MPIKIKKKFIAVRDGACRFLDRFGVYLPGLIVVAMITLFYMPDRSMALQYDRMGILSGQFWRFYTYCLTHWESFHLGCLILRHYRIFMLGKESQGILGYDDTWPSCSVPVAMAILH